MPKDCGCNKKENTHDSNCDKDKGKRNQIWVYKKKCNINPDIPDNSYQGKIGFTYYLVNNDTKKKTEFKVEYRFSNLIPGEIVYYVSLYKVIKTEFDKKKNTITKYIKCFSQYSYTKKIEQLRIIDIINHIGNDNYDLIPDDSNEFNNYVIKNILKPNKSSKNKNTKNRLTVQISQVGKEYGTQGCGGGCDYWSGVLCGTDCAWCQNFSCVKN